MYIGSCIMRGLFGVLFIDWRCVIHGTLTKQENGAVLTADRRCFRRILGLKLSDRIRNDDVRKYTGNAV